MDTRICWACGLRTSNWAKLQNRYNKKVVYLCLDCFKDAKLEDAKKEGL